MNHVLLYWNHICVLHQGEKKLLEALKAALAQEQIDLEVRYFGLGYPMHMSEYLGSSNAILPDIMVSADLEIYENRNLFSKFQEDLYPAASWLPLQSSPALTAVHRDSTLLPFTAIPLVYYTFEPDVAKQTALPHFEELAFGGINNSAAKTIMKAVWQLAGKEQAVRFMQRSHVSDMPIGGYQTVRMAQKGTALVPSLYALRADGKSSFLVHPQEGPLLLPSYIAVRNTLPEDVARRVVDVLVSLSFCDFYAQSGDLILLPDRTSHQSTNLSDHYLALTPDFLHALSPAEFYNTYCACLPSARNEAFD